MELPPQTITDSPSYDTTALCPYNGIGSDSPGTVLLVAGSNTANLVKIDPVNFSIYGGDILPNGRTNNKFQKIEIKLNFICNQLN